MSKKRSLISKYNLKSWYNYYAFLSYNYYCIFFGSLIFRGNKLQAFDFLLKIRNGVKIKENIDWNLIFLVSMLNITPKINLFLLRLGGSSKKVPLPISERKQISFAIRWLKILAKNKSRVISLSNMVELICSSLYNKGEVVQKKLDAHAIALENRYLIKYFN